MKKLLVKSQIFSFIRSLSWKTDTHKYTRDQNKKTLLFFNCQIFCLDFTKSAYLQLWNRKAIMKRVRYVSFLCVFSVQQIIQQNNFRCLQKKENKQTNEQTLFD